MGMNKRGQVAIEYILIFAFILLITVGIINAVGQRIIFVQKDNNEETRHNILNYLTSHVELASAADDGFETTFRLPSNVEGFNYSINISDDSVVIVEFADGTSYEALLNNVVGKFCHERWDKPKYLVSVQKVNGVVEVSSCDNCTVSYQTCDEAEENGNCGALSAGELDECQNGYCKCLP